MNKEDLKNKLNTVKSTVKEVINKNIKNKDVELTKGKKSGEQKPR